MPQVPNRQRYETIFSDSIQQDLTKQEKAIRKLLKSGEKPDRAFWKGVDKEVSDTTSILLRPLHERGQRNTASAKRKISDIRDKANDWAQERADQLAKELRQTTADGLKELTDKLKDKSLTVRDRKEILDQGMTDLFGQARAERIATTEVTNAFTSGEMSGAEGRGLLAIWNVGPKPCKVCKKLEGKPRRVWGRKFPNGPPAHPSCNCYLTWSVRIKESVQVLEGNPNHKGKGPGGGQFTSGSSDGGGGSSETPSKKSPKSDYKGFIEKQKTQVTPHTINRNLPGGELLIDVRDPATILPNYSHEIAHTIHDYLFTNEQRAEWKKLANEEKEKLGPERHARAVTGDPEEDFPEAFSTWVSGDTWQHTGETPDGKEWKPKYGGLPPSYREFLNDNLGPPEKLELPTSLQNNPSPDLSVARDKTGRRTISETPTAKPTSTKQTDSPEFKNWFGDSKVVDDKGQPLVVYHGTDKDYSEFKNPYKGEHGVGFEMFSTKPEYSANFAVGTGANIKPIYLSVQKPLDLTHIPHRGGDARAKILTALRRAGVSDEAMDELHEKLAYGSSIFQVLNSESGKHHATLVNELKRLGIDGIKMNEHYQNTPAITWIVFDPTKIKSATGNKGKFDPSSSNITESNQR